MSEQLNEQQTMPLDGCRVIDVSSFLAGPFCSTQLAEFGAEVIKLELPKVGDALRKFGTITKSGDSLPWLSECRNKKTATLDLRTPEGAALLKRLIADADMFVENFQPGTLEKWGLGWGRAERDQPAADHGADLRLWADRALSGPARVRPDRQCVRRAVVPGRLPGSATGDAGLGHDP